MMNLNDNKKLVKCKMCGKEFMTERRSQMYCGSKTLGTGCSYINAKNTRQIKDGPVSHYWTPHIRVQLLTPEVCECGNKFIRTPHLKTCPTCRLKTKLVS